MKLKRCENGHFYDEEQFSSCPHCSSAAQAQTPLDQESSGAAQAPVSQPEIKPVKPADSVTDPVVGWLVAFEGKHYGEDFKLKSGENSIGRYPSNDVKLSKDNYVSREKHAVLLYDQNENAFYIQRGASEKPFYHNGAAVSAPEPLSSGDVISVGTTKLLFIPCCTDRFCWNTPE